MKQISLYPEYSSYPASLCLGRLVGLGLFFGLAMALLWGIAGPSPAGRAVVWAIAIVAGLKLWRAIEGA